MESSINGEEIGGKGGREEGRYNIIYRIITG
jgi:hypothetical protein